MAGRRKTQLTGSLALVLAVGLTACGGSGGTTSTTASATTTSSTTPPPSTTTSTAKARPTPKRHRGSGAGAAQFRVKGGDNSVQEFGGEASRSELEEAGAALHGFLDARVAGEWGKACTYLAAAAAKSFEQLASRSKHGGGSCGATMAALSGGVPKGGLEEAAQADVGALRIEGGRGFLLYHGARGTDYAISVAKEGGAWKVGALAGTPLS